jgi:hypothetical protein
LAFVADFGTQNFNLKTKFDMENKTSINHENGNDANRLLAAAAIWWERLTPLKKELFESKYGKIDNQKINDIYKMHTDWSNEDLEQVSSCG